MATVSLAEPRRRQKWTLNPRGNLWANDESKFGHRLMERMGWEKGRGLGANLDGMVTSVKVRQKDNQKGVGFEGSDDTWLAHQDDFQAVLAALNVEHGSAGEGLTEGEKKASLEAISRKSRRRVHYQKFVKGKDSSNYSADDLGCILGTKSDKVGAKAKAVEEESKESKEEDTGKFTQATGSYQDYFASKMAAMRAKGKFSDVPDWKDDSASPQTMGLGAAGGRQVDREIQRDSLLNPDYLQDTRGGSGAARGAQEAAEDIKEAAEQMEPVTKKSKKKKKEKYREEEKAEEEVVVEEEEPERKKKKKSKKSQNEAVEEVVEEVEEVVCEEKKDEPEKRKKKSKKVKEEAVEEVVQVVEEIAEESEEKIRKKKSKKSKKEKNIDSDVTVEDSGCEENEVKVKKSKKSKKEKNKEEEVEAPFEDVEEPSTAPEPSNKRKVEETEAEEAPKKKKKKSKKSKLMDEAAERNGEGESFLAKNYPEAPGSFRGSNLLAIPGYGQGK